QHRAARGLDPGRIYRGGGAGIGIGWTDPGAMPRGYRSPGAWPRGWSTRVRIRARDLRQALDRGLLHPAGAQHMHPVPGRSLGDLVEHETLGQLADQGARRCRPQVLLGSTGDGEVVTGSGRRSDRGREAPALERHALPRVPRLAAHDDRTPREAGETLALRLLIEPGPVGGHAVTRLGGERQARCEPEHNWKGAEGPARLHPLQYGKEAWAAHPGRPDRARRLGLSSRP